MGCLLIPNEYGFTWLSLRYPYPFHCPNNTVDMSFDLSWCVIWLSLVYCSHWVTTGLAQTKYLESVTFYTTSAFIKLWFSYAHSRLCSLKSATRDLYAGKVIYLKTCHQGHFFALICNNVLQFVSRVRNICRDFTPLLKIPIITLERSFCVMHPRVFLDFPIKCVECLTPPGKFFVFTCVQDIYVACSDKQCL